MKIRKMYGCLLHRDPDKRKLPSALICRVEKRLISVPKGLRCLTPMLLMSKTDRRSGPQLGSKTRTPGAPTPVSPELEHDHLPADNRPENLHRPGELSVLRRANPTMGTVQSLPKGNSMQSLLYLPQRAGRWKILSLQILSAVALALGDLTQISSVSRVFLSSKKALGHR